MGGSSLCAEVLRSVFGVAPGYPELVRPRHDRRAHAHHGRRAPDAARTLFLVASKSGGTVEVASMERFFWARMSQARWRRTPDATSSPSPIRARRSRRSRRTRGYREMFVNPPDIGGRFSALSLFGLVPAALIGAPVDSICSTAARRWPTAAGRTITRTPGSSSARSSAQPRSTDATSSPSSCRRRCVARPLDRTARRREHRQARQGRAAGRRRAARAARTNTATIARSSSSRPIGRAGRRAARGARSGRPSGAAPDDAARRARRGVLPLGVRHRGRRRGARHQSVRRAERVGSQGEDQGAACASVRDERSRFDDGAAGRPRRSCATPCDAAIASARSRGDYVAFLSYLPRGQRRRGGAREIRARAARANKVATHLRRRPALPALDRSVSQGWAEHRASRS